MHAAAPTGDDCFRLAMAASGIGMAIVELDGRWREVNPAAERLLGRKASELAGRQVFEVIHRDDVDAAREALEGLVQGRREVIDAPRRYLHRNGEVVWVHTNAAALRDASGQPQLLVVQLRDISRERQAQAVLQADATDRAAALDVSNQHLQMFADSVAHDLRAPLRSIESFSAMLDQRIGESLDPTSRDHLDRIRAAATRMSGLLAALGELSHATRAELKPGPVDLTLLAEWAVAELREAEPERDAEVRISPGLVAHGDERLLKLAIAQLLSNAWKFSRQRDRVFIEVVGGPGADGVRLTVRDAGCGFDMRYAHKLFQPFQRLHGADEGAGHGLGLAIAQRVVERHGGRMSAASEPGVGSTFQMDLPPPPDY
ncbi:MAG: PAS domain S-box protein [Lysobacter spongiicola]|nr:PAS domain S-box protein [Lysobacter spongiicola]